MTDLQRRRAQRAAKWSWVTTMLLVWAVLGFPVAALALKQFLPTAALYLPLLVIVPGLCILCPNWRLPIIALLTICGSQYALLLMEVARFEPNFMAHVMVSPSVRLVPPAAVALGYAALLIRLHRPIWRWRVKSNLHILTARPDVFVRKYFPAIIVLLAGAALDTATTMMFMHKSRVEDELHPAMQAVATLYGIDVGVPLGTIARLFFVLLVASLWRRWCRFIIVLCGVLYASAAAWNYVVP